MRLRLVPRSAEIEIRDLPLPQHAETIHPLGAAIDPRARGSGRDEEHRLSSDEIAMILVHAVEEFHGECSRLTLISDAHNLCA